MAMRLRSGVICMRRGGRGQRAGARGAQLLTFAAFAAAAAVSAALAADTRAVMGRVGGGAGAASMEGALVQAYVNNPQLNAQRAATRAVDENVPTALAGYRPRITGTASLTEQYLDNLTRTPAVGTTLQTKAGPQIGSGVTTDLSNVPQVYTRNFGSGAVSSAG